MLESFTETRSTAEATEACTSAGSTYAIAENNLDRYVTGLNKVDSIMIVGNSQNPWDFDVQPDADFADQVKFFYQI